MMIGKRSITILSLVLALLGLVICRACHTTASTEITETIEPLVQKKPIVLADISDNPQKKIRKFQPLADYLAANLNQFDQGKVKIAPDMETMIDWLQSGEVDIYIDSPYPAMLAINGADAKPILHRWENGRAEYFSLIMTLRDRNINSLEDLQGQTIAFDNPFSTTGYMLPLAELLNAGLKPIETSFPNNSIAKDTVGYIFSYEDENSIELLISGQVAAAATDNRYLEKMSPEIKEQTLVLAKTEPIARNLVMVRSDLPSDQVKAIAEILLAMDQTTEGKKILEQFSLTTKFDDYLTEESLVRIQKIYQKSLSNEVAP